MDNNQTNFDQNRQPPQQDVPVNPYAAAYEQPQQQFAPPPPPPPQNVQFAPPPPPPQPTYQYNAYTAPQEPAEDSPEELASRRKAAVVTLIFGIVSAVAFYLSSSAESFGSFFTYFEDLPLEFTQTMSVLGSLFGICCSIVAIVFGAIAKSRAAKLVKHTVVPLRGCVIAGKIVGTVGFILGIIMTAALAISLSFI